MIKTIKLRTGDEKNLDTSKLIAGEIAVTLDTKKMFMCFYPGYTKRLMTEEDLQQVLNSSSDAYKLLSDLLAELNSDQSLSASILSRLDNLEKGINVVNEKANIFIGSELPEINKRDSKTMYLKVTDTINTSVNDNIQVSPTMGIKII